MPHLISPLYPSQAGEQFAAAEKFWSKADKDLPELPRIQDGSSAAVIGPAALPR